MSLLDHVPLSRPFAVRVDRRWVIPGAVALMVLARLPFLEKAASPDEAGYLMIGSQWHAGGSSLYGNYWVDRPPLLISAYQLAATLGGLPALRLLGCLAAVLIVLGSAAVAGLVAGQRAARWAAVVAAALCVTPTLGVFAVNGELLAGPFVVGSVVAAVAALRSADDGRAGRLAMAAGAAAMCALLVKQNMADGFVFGAVATVVAWHRREVDGRRATRILTSALSGAVVALGVVAVWTLVHGTSLAGVFDAMYPFRLQASKVMASADQTAIDGRLIALIAAAVASGVAVLMAVAVWGAATRRLSDAVSWGLCATILFGVVSVALGGNYWTHYLVEMIGPLAMVSGLLVARRQRAIRPVVLAVVAASVLAWSTWLISPPDPVATVVGRSIGASSQPGDTIVAIYGHADVAQSSGLSSPYPYLWSLPLKTRDPKLTQLDAVVTGPTAPTWFVTWGSTRTWGVDSAGLRSALRSRYTLAAKVCGRSIYLLDGVVRPAPRAPTSCSTAPATVTASQGVLR
jgi:hypothetical protein